MIMAPATFIAPEYIFPPRKCEIVNTTIENKAIRQKLINSFLFLSSNKSSLFDKLLLGKK
ncbi:MAG: hypothetical protein BM556_01820 [Bacteriovorax sp. MedPE-SWde]|nr:MAG: hypothetical protein BM556_01820 [Bacteriovorax sp. MedPE-SWde]